MGCGGSTARAPTSSSSPEPSSPAVSPAPSSSAERPVRPVPSQPTASKTTTTNNTKKKQPPPQQKTKAATTATTRKETNRPPKASTTTPPTNTTTTTSTDNNNNIMAPITPKDVIPNIVKGVKGTADLVRHTPDFVAQHTKHFTSMIQGGANKMGAHHLKNVFAVPLEMTDSYHPPHHAKTAQEADFLRQAILQNFVFANMTQKELRILIGAFEKIHCKGQDTIIQQGDTGDYFYVLVSGQVQFVVDDKPVGTARDGHTFGELSLLYTSPRAATVLAIQDCELFRVDQMTFRFILQAQTKQTDQEINALLRGVPFLAELDGSDLNKLVGVLTPRPFAKGDCLVRKGDEGDFTFYIIQEGSVQVTDIQQGGNSYEDQMLTKGDYFGEQALVTHEPRAANCIAATNGVALKIDSETFEKVMGNLSRLMDKANDKRRLGAIKIIQDSSFNERELVSLAGLIIDNHYKKGFVLMEQGGDTEAALYMVRDGTVVVTSEDGKFTKTVNHGGYFGEDMLTFDTTSKKPEGGFPDPILPAKYTVQVTEDATIGALTLEECRTVVDTTYVGRGKERHEKDAQVYSLLAEEEVQLSDLKRHKILGAGTFGQVWLVSRKNRDGVERPYALKIQSKYDLIKNSQAKGVVQEKTIMSNLRHPFIIELVKTFQDDPRVYMLLRLIQGGELFTVLHHDGMDGIPEKSAIFYSAAILDGLSYMHRRHILYRDLKPENVLVDAEGYPCIVDLGFAKVVHNKTYTLCGTPLYIAPEVVLNRGHDKGADHWSLAVLIYEMIAGYTPFYRDGMDQITLFRAICKGEYKFPRKGVMSAEVEDLLLRMLETNPSQRLGSLARGSKDLFGHYWFHKMNWEKLRYKELRAPWKPKIKNPLDTSQFESWDHLEDKMKVKDPKLSAQEQAIFSVF